MTTLADLTDEEIVSVLHAVQFLKKKLDYQGGLFHARQGNMVLNAGTVPHLHFNDFQPDPVAIQRLVDEIPTHRRWEGKRSRYAYQSLKIQVTAQKTRSVQLSLPHNTHEIKL